MLMLQRASTSLMFYFRVRAIYPSNLYLQAVFLLLITGVAISCVIAPYYSGFTSGVFDLVIFLAIFWKFIWKSDDHWRTTVWSLFQRGRRDQIKDKFLRASLFYILWVCLSTSWPGVELTVIWKLRITVISKIPQIYFRAHKCTWGTFMMMPDTSITCVLAGQIYRDMKLGYTQSVRETETSSTPHLSGVHFLEVSHSGRIHETSRLSSFLA